MPVITLPDGSQRTFQSPVSVFDVAAEIGPGLAKATLAGKVDGKIVDAAYVIENDIELSIITDKNEEGLEIIRHSSAHLLAQAVKDLFPSAQITIGPVVDDGFYYDIDYEPRFSPDDRRISFTSDAGGGDNIWIMNMDGSHAKQVTNESFRLLNTYEPVASLSL